MKCYKLLEGITIADVAFEAFGKTEADLLENCALATMDVQADIKTVNPKITVSFQVKAPTLEKLVFAFLDELIYLKDAKGMLFSKFVVKVAKNGGFHVAVDCLGDVIDPDKQKLKVDVKAVTYHKFEVRKLPDGRLRAQVVLDI